MSAKREGTQMFISNSAKFGSNSLIVNLIQNRREEDLALLVIFQKWPPIIMILSRYYHGG